MTGNKIALYYTHYQCLGHTTRVLSIAHGIRKLTNGKTSIYLLEGSLPQNFLKAPSYFQRIKLPFSLYSRDNFKIPPKSNFFEIELRAKFLFNRIVKLNPDIFITDHFPFGHRESRYELLPVLQYLRKKGKTVICSLGYPFFSLKNIAELIFFLQYYNRILVHTPPVELEFGMKSLRDKAKAKEYKSIFSSKKIKFCNYILPYNMKREDSCEKIKSLTGRKLILVTRGAGAYYPNIISSSILASKYFKEYQFLVVAGPSSTREEWDLFMKLTNRYGAKNLVLKKFIPDLPSYFRTADIVISAASYNTAIMLMYYKKKSIVIPFEGYSKDYSFWEQRVRSKLLSKNLGASVIDYVSLTPEILKEEIISQLGNRGREGLISLSWFNGREKAASAILSE